MEVVCLILGLTLTSQPCSHAFWVLTSLHLSPFLLKMFLLFLYIYRGPVDLLYHCVVVVAQWSEHCMLKACSPGSIPSYCQMFAFQLR